MMAFLEIEKGNSKDIGKRIPLGESPAIIGRLTPDSKSDIKIHDDFVSRQHAEISYQQNCYMLRDLESTNGTQLDGEKIIPSKFYPLMHNSTIGLGIAKQEVRVLLRFKESPTTATARIEDTDTEESRFLNWLKIDEKRNEVRVDGKPITVSKKEYQMLLCLYSRTGKICSRETIIAEVWPEVMDTQGVSDAAIDQMVHRLRMKVEIDASLPKRIISRKGFGYMLVE
ncbi:MAG: FHA domain-containing protein [Dehalococcoidales bacterium]